MGVKLTAINNYGLVVHKPLASSVDNCISICSFERRTIFLMRRGAWDLRLFSQTKQQKKVSFVSCVSVPFL